MQIDVLSLFPELIENYCQTSILGLALKQNLYQLKTHNPRDYSKDKHHKVDDTPYGGGAGMVLSPQPWIDCLAEVLLLSDSCVTPAPHPETMEIIVTSPSGIPFNQELARELSTKKQLIILCGRYEGFDQRIRDRATMEISVGDYVLTGGEIAALSIIDATVRHIPGVLGDPESLKEESFSKLNYLEKLKELQVSKKEMLNFLEETGISREELEELQLLEHPHYTRPADFRGEKIPEILESGDHKKIFLWRLAEAIKLTRQKRGDLLN